MTANAATYSGNCDCLDTNGTAFVTVCKDSMPECTIACGFGCTWVGNVDDETLKIYYPSGGYSKSDCKKNSDNVVVEKEEVCWFCTKGGSSSYGRYIWGDTASQPSVTDPSENCQIKKNIPKEKCIGDVSGFEANEMDKPIMDKPIIEDNVKPIEVEDDVTLSFCAETHKVWKLAGYVVFVLKILVPSILIIIGSLDLGKAVVAQNEDEIKKGTQLLIKRVIAGVIIFFIPLLVKIVFGWVAGASASISENNSCIICITDPGSC